MLRLHMTEHYGAEYTQVSITREFHLLHRSADEAGALGSQCRLNHFPFRRMGNEIDIPSFGQVFLWLIVKMQTYGYDASACGHEDNKALQDEIKSQKVKLSRFSRTLRKFR